MTKRRRGQDEGHRHHHHHHNHHHQQDDDFIPLPIQTFLWRQTSPFVRPFLGKARDLAQIEQRDACKLFERIIITNNIWGQSPSLTDAISSIDRWRLIKVSFPFVLQCTAALLNNKLIKDHNFNRLGGNEAKMMYTLQWILMNASEECADSENEAKSNATNVAIAAATAASLLKPMDSQMGQGSGGSGAAGGAAGGLGASVGVSGQASNSGQLSSRLDQQAAGTSGANTSSSGQTNQSIVMPAAAAVVAIGQPAGLTTLQTSAQQQQQQQQQSQAPQPQVPLQQQQQHPNSSSSVSPIGSSTPTQAAVSTVPPGQASTASATAATSCPALQASSPNKYLLPISSIQMFAYYFAPIMDGLKHSDFLSSNQRLEIGAALWEPLFNYQLPDIHCLKARIKRDPSQEVIEQQTLISEPAMRQQQQQQQQPTLLTTNITTKPAGGEYSIQAPTTIVTGAHQGGATLTSTIGDDRRRSSSVFNDPAHFGDVFLGGPTPTIAASTPEDPTLSRASGTGATGASMSAHMEQSILLTKSSPATYLDVAILRCLFVSDWQESGVYWAINYLSNRFNEDLYINKQADEDEGDDDDDDEYSFDDDEFSGGNEHLQQQQVRGVRGNIVAGRRRAKATRLARLMRKSKSLSCVSSDDLRRSLTLRRDHFKRQRGQLQNTTGADKTMSQDSSGADPRLEQQQTSSSSSSRFLRVEDTSESGLGGGGATTGGDQKERGEPKSPIRRLSFSSGMQTLANQIRKTSKRVKKGPDERQTSGENLNPAAQQATSSSQTNINTAAASALGAQSGCEQSTTSSTTRLSRHRRSSSADNLSLSQVSALSVLSQQQDRQMTDSNPVITVTPNSNTAIAAAAATSGTSGACTGQQQPSASKTPRSASPTGEKHRKRTRKTKTRGDTFESGDTATAEVRGAADTTTTTRESLDQSTIGHDDGGARQYLMQSLYLRSLKHFERLTRSHTIPANMRFVAAPLSELQPGSLDKSESLGADFYVDERGRIDPLVVLKIIHSISQRDNACSLRVCDKVLFLMNRLINIGILSDQGGRRGRRRSSAAAGFVLEDRANLLPTRRQHEFNLLHRVVHVPSSSGGARRESTTTGGDDREMLDSVRQNLIHKVLIDIVFRLHHHLGCPNHCGMPSTVDHHHKGQQNFRQKVSSFSGGRQTLAATTGDNLIASGKNLRLSLRDSLEYLSAFNKQSFIKYVQDVFTDRDLRHVVDILHSLLGFCRPDYLSYLKHRNQTGTAAATGAGGGSGAATTTTTTTTTTGQASHTTVQFATASGVIGGGKATQPAATATMDSAATATAATVVNALQAKRRKSLPALDPVESIIVTNSFKQLVTRMASMTKELKMAQNNSLYCDIRRLINFIRENYNSTFRSIVLSALIDCTRFLNKQQQQQQQHRESNQSEVALRTQQQHNQQQQQQHHQQQQQTLTRPSSEEESLAGGVGPSQTTTTTTSRDKRASDKQILSTDEELSTTDTTSIHHQSQHGASQMSGVVAGSASSSHQHQPRTSMSSHRFQATASPSHMGRSATIQGSGSPTQGQSVGGAHEARESSTTTGILSLSKAKKKLEQVFGGGGSSGAVSSGGSKLKLGDELNLSTGGGSLGGGGGGAGQLQTTDLTAETTNQSYNSGPEESSRRASLVGHQSIVSMGGGEHQALVYPAGVVGAASIGPLSIQIIKQNQLIYETVQAGMSNFAFLMESCLPGDFLDPALLAALLDLKSPIAIRAAVFLECANFVHRCNRGQWPSWMRMNLAPSSGGGGQRASNAGFMPGMASSKMRKSSSVQRTARNNTLMYRAAGRAFYAWAEAVGARLEELLADSSSENSSNDQQQQQSCQDGSTTADGRQASLDEHNKSHRQRCSHQSSSTPNQTNSSNLANETLLMQDVDFLQPTLANDSSPFVLKMAACQLLFEVTTFLRETYRYLPPTIVQHQIAGSGKTGDKMSSIYDVSRAVTANRRWSMALSSLGFGQLPATLSNLGALTSGGGNVAPPQQPASNTSGASLRANPASTSLSEQPERRISFILHETKGEDQIREEEEEEEGDGGDETARKQRDSVPATSGTGGGDSSSASHHYDMQSIAGSEHEAAASNSLRRITSGSSGRHLSQSSASSAVVVAAATLLRSSGVIESQTHRRKSIKLKKSGQDKEKQDKKTKFSVGATSAGVGGGPGSSGQTGDFDEELENSSLSDVGGMRRTDSMRSRRRVSGISDTSANGLASSTTTNQTGGALVGTSGGAGAQESTGTGGAPTTGAAGELSGNESAGNGSVAGCDDHLLIGGTEGSLGKFEADESKIMSHMPWFKAISLVNSSIDCDCSHFPSCKPSCYKLHQSTCKRLISFVQTIYKDPTEQNYLSSIFEKRLANLISDQKQLHKQQKQASSSSSDHHHHHHHKSQHGSKSGAIFRAGSDCSGADSGEPSQWSHHKKKDKKLKKRSQPTVEPTAAGQQQQQLVDQEQSLSSPKMTTTSSKHHPDSTTTTGAGSKTQATMMIGRHHHHGFSASHMHGGSGGGHGGHGCKLQPTSVVDETINILRAAKAKERTHEEPPMIKYLRSNVRSLLHCPMSSFLKGAIILPRESFAEMIRFSWNLLLEDDQQLSRTAAVCFIVSAIKCPNEASKLLIDELESTDASRKMAAINKFYVVWDARYQCWPRLEDGAFVHFKMAPPSIEFTLPSPKIAQESSPVVDPPWMPRKTSNVEEVTIGQDQTVQKSFVTATKTRRKQQIEIVTKALREKHDKLREDREIYNITSVPVTLYAAFEPTLGNQGSGGLGGPDGELDGSGGGGGGATADEDAQQENRALFQMKTAQALFPTCLCQSAIVMINLLDDPRVTYEGSAVYEIASKVIWSCLVEDPALFLRYFFERLTRQNQSTIFQVLRRLIRFMPRLPPQAAYTLYNYLIGFIIYYIRCPFENSQKLISDTLSVLCLVVPSVHGLFLKDLKQILRKEQCDHNLLITANVPSAKKIIIHGSDSSGIPSQFPIDESTQFYHVLVDSLEFFGIDKSKQNEYFLIDVRTNLMHNLHSYVRDYYSFKRSQHPQLQLINMNPSKAFDILQRQELVNQFMEFGKVLMSLSIVKSSHMAVQRALFLHEELMKLPTFPRKALETNFSLFRGPLGHQVFSMDRIHKICWVRVIARMFELTSGFFLQLGDIQLFLNAISGIFVLHCEEASVSRLCLATFINATHQFKSIFATDGFMPIMSTIVQVYSNHQNNQLLCKSIEYVCKQFYIMHRKPFLLQLFGSVASKLNTAEILQHNQITSPVGLYQLSYQSQQQQQQQFGQQSGSSSSALGVGSGGGSASVGANSSSANTTSGTSGYIQLNDPNRISPSAFFRLLLSLEKAFKDPLDILELVDIEKPLRAVDFCYQQDKESIDILDIISLCVTVTAYASESPRSTQMLIILESVVPLYMKHLQASTSKKAGQSMGKQAHKDELQKIQSISICIRTLIVNCEGLTRNFNGPLASFDFRSSSIRRTGPSGNRASRGVNANNSAGSPLDIYADEPSLTGPELSGKQGGGGRNKSSANEQTTGHGHSGGGKQTTFATPASKSKSAASGAYNNDETEITRGEFIVPRDTLLNLVAEFLSLSTGRLVESAKKYVELHQKHSSYELLDVKSHLRLAEVANSLLKFASTDPSVMACRGLIRYMNEILPNTEWRQEAIRPALIMILKRLDKTFNRIAKKNWVKKSTDWEAAKELLKGAYLTFIKHPYIVHLPHLKSLISCCQNIILSDGLQSSPLGSNLLHGFASAASTAVASSTAGATVTGQQQQQQQQQGQLTGLAGAAGQSGSGSGPMSQTPGAGGKFQASASNLLSVGHQGTSGRFGKSSSPSLSSAGGAGATSGPTGFTTDGVPLSSSSPAGSGAAGGGSSQQATPSLAAVTAAAALAERLASGAGTGSSITSQGFNSVTIRLIAMQLLQTGDSQTLESFIGNSMNTPEKLESLMLNLIYPMSIRVCSGAREAPKLRVCDIMFILNIVLQMLAPQSASSKSCSSFANSPKSTTDTSQFILSKITTTIGSTQTGATALNIVGGSSSHSQASAHQISQHPEALKIGFLGLKILCVCFESQLASEWVRISRVIRDLSLHSNQPSNPLWDFLDFVATYRFPMFVLLLPTIKCDIAKKVKQLEQARASGGLNSEGPASACGLSMGMDAAQLANYRQNLSMIEAKIHGSTPTVFRSKSFLFVSLTAELRMLKEQLIAKRKQQIDGERNQHHHNLSGQTSGASGGGGGHGGGASGSGHSGAGSGQGAGSSALAGSGQGPSAGLGSGSSDTGGDHFGGAYHRLSAAIASFANQSQMGKLSPSASAASSQLGTSAALKGACFAAQLATSAAIGPQVSSSGSGGGEQPASSQSTTAGAGGGGSSQSSIRLSTAKSREEARKVMNTILRRTSYPHNQPTNLIPPPSAGGSEATTSGGAGGGGERKGSQPASPSMSMDQRRQAPLAEVDIEAGQGGDSCNQIIMDPAMLIKAAFPAAPRKSNVEGSGILKQLVQTIDRQNTQRQMQQLQRNQRTYRPTAQDQRAACGSNNGNNDPSTASGRPGQPTSHVHEQNENDENKRMKE